MYIVSWMKSKRSKRLDINFSGNVRMCMNLRVWKLTAVLLHTPLVVCYYSYIRMFISFTSCLFFFLCRCFVILLEILLIIYAYNMKAPFLTFKLNARHIMCSCETDSCNSIASTPLGGNWTGNVVRMRSQSSIRSTHFGHMWVLGKSFLFY